MNLKALEEKITASGLKKKHIASTLGISSQGLINKLSGVYDFTRKEVNELCRLLDITDLEEKESIFFDD